MQTARPDILDLVMVLLTPRGWYRRLSLSWISRAMPTTGQVKTRHKRLHRFLNNPHFQTELLSSELLGLAVDEVCSYLVPVVVDQTAVGDVQVLTGSYPVHGRAILLFMTTFEYNKLVSGQTRLEEDFFQRFVGALPQEAKLV